MERLERIVNHLSCSSSSSQIIEFHSSPCSGECPVRGKCPFASQQQQQQQQSSQMVCPMKQCPFAKNRKQRYLKPAMRVCITGAAGQIAYSLVGQIASGRMLGEDQPIILQLLDIPMSKEALNGVVMELEDCAYPLLQQIIATTEAEEAFSKTDIAIFVGAFPRKQGMERKDLIEKNAEIFHEQGAILARCASPNVKVLVVGNPANTNCLLLLESAKSIPKQNFSCLTRLDHNRAKAQISNKLNVPIASVHNVIIWGNHSSTQYPSISSSYVSDYPVPDIQTSSASSINDEQWVREKFIPIVQNRGAEIIKARKLSSALSAANAIVDHVHDWIIGTPAGEFVSMGVLSDGNSYGVPSGLIFSFPVRCENGNWTIVDGLQLDQFAKQKIEITTKELLEEKQAAFSYIQSKRSN